MLVWFSVLGGPRARRRSSRTARDRRRSTPLRAVDVLPRVPARAASGRSARSSSSSPAARRSTPTWVTSGAGRSSSAGSRLVFPALVLQLLRAGRAAAATTPRPSRTRSSCWRPDWAIWPLVILATMATVIASQALISGAFSLTTQAMQLDYLPRVAVLHTSASHIGQVYVPIVNWILMVACIGLVIGFQIVEQAGRGVRHRGHDDDGHHHAAVHGRRRASAGAGRRLGRRRSASRCWSSTWRSSGAQVVKIPHGGWFALGGRRRPVHADDDVAQGPAHRRGRDPARRDPDRGVRRPAPGDRCTGAGAGHGGVPVQGRRGHAARAASSTCATTRCCTSRSCCVSIETTDAPTRAGRRPRSTSPRSGPGIWQVVFTFGFLDQPDVPDALGRSRPAACASTPTTSPTSSAARPIVSTPHAHHERRGGSGSSCCRAAPRPARRASSTCRPARVFEVGTTIEI